MGKTQAIKDISRSPYRATFELSDDERHVRLIIRKRAGDSDGAATELHQPPIEGLRSWQGRRVLKHYAENMTGVKLRFTAPIPWGVVFAGGSVTLPLEEVAP